MDKEIWKDIEGYEGLYQVSNMGRVRRLRLIRCAKDESGYQRVGLSKNAIGKTCFVHRLVALAFLNKNDGKDEINHIDGNKQNNRVSNLEWVTRNENMKHASENNLIRKGENNGRAKISNEQATEIRRIYIPYHKEYGTIGLAKRYGISQTAICNIINGKTYTNV